MHLDPRALNRALLARQFLLQPATTDPLTLIEHLIGLQAQAPFPPYYGLWCRLARFTPDQLATHLQDRTAVRIALMRATVHLVSAEDCRTLRPLLQPVLLRGLRANTTYRAALDGIDLDELATHARALLEHEPLPNTRLGPLLARHWPGRDPAALAAAARSLLPLVQVTPRAVWGASAQTAHTTAEHWLGTPLHDTPTPDNVILRYLAAYGPASVKDAQKWSGLTGLRAVLERLRPRLATFTDDHGVELFDLPDAPRPDPDTTAPVRLVPEFDNLTLSHADRTRVLSEQHRRRLFSTNGIIAAALLVDGFVHGTWRIHRADGNATAVITPFAPVPIPHRAAIEHEALRLLAFDEPEATPHVHVLAAP